MSCGAKRWTLCTSETWSSCKIFTHDTAGGTNSQVQCLCLIAGVLSVPHTECMCAGETAWMSLDEFLDLLDMAELFDDQYVWPSPKHFPRVPHRITLPVFSFAERDGVTAFVLAMQPVHDEMQTYRHQRMTFVEMLEAVRAMVGVLCVVQWLMYDDLPPQLARVSLLRNKGLAREQEPLCEQLTELIDLMLEMDAMFDDQIDPVAGPM